MLPNFIRWPFQRNPGTHRPRLQTLVRHSHNRRGHQKNPARHHHHPERRNGRHSPGPTPDRHGPQPRPWTGCSSDPGHERLLHLQPASLLHQQRRGPSNGLLPAPKPSVGRKLEDGRQLRHHGYHDQKQVQRRRHTGSSLLPVSGEISAGSRRLPCPIAGQHHQLD